MTGADGAVISVKNLASLPAYVVRAFPAAGRGAAAIKAAQEKAEAAAWNGLVDKGGLIERGTKEGTKTYDRWMRPILNFAEQRDIAALHVLDKTALEAIPFLEIVSQAEAFPANRGLGTLMAVGGTTSAVTLQWPWRQKASLEQPAPAPAVSVTAGADDTADADLPSDMKAGKSLQARILDGWSDFITYCAVKGDSRKVTPADQQKPALFWIRTRPFWPDLSELMIYWLTVPVSTAGLERGFSFQTLIDQDTRRRRLGAAHLRDDMLCHLFRDFLETSLEKAL